MEEVLLSQDNKSQHIKTESSVSRDLTKEDIKSNLRKIFFNFGQYYPSDGEFLITFSSVLKIMKTLTIVDEKTIKQSDIDIICKSLNGSSNRLNEKKFFEFVVCLSKRLEPSLFKQDARLCIQQVYQEFFEPLCRFIDDKTVSLDDMNSGMFLHKGIEDFINSYSYDYKHKSIINNIYDTLREIYKVYFFYEVNSYNDVNKIIENSLSNLIQFAREFDIIPYCLTMSQIYVYYNIVITQILDDDRTRHLNELISKEKDLGVIFTLARFSMMILHFSLLSFGRISHSYIEIDSMEQLMIFLEKMENSKGFINLDRKTNRPQKGRMTLVPEKTVLSMISSEMLESFELVNDKAKARMLKEASIIKEIHSKNTKEDYTLRKILSIDSNSYKLLLEKLSLLKDLFISYTRYTDKLSFNKLNYTAYIKLLKDARLVESSSEANRFRSDIWKNKDVKNSQDMGLRGISNDKSNTSMLTKQSIDIKSYRKSIALAVDSVKGKLTETDVSLIFQHLTGPKNLEKMNSTIDKNKGVSVSFLDSQGITIDKNNKIKTSHNSLLHRLDFYLFIKSFEIICLKLHPNAKLNSAFKHFLEEDLREILAKRKEISVLYSNKMLQAVKEIKNPSVSALVELLHEIVKPHYDLYSEKDGYMNFEQLFEFYKDFDIFPDIVNLIQIKSIFNILSESLSVAVQKEIDPESRDFNSASSFMTSDRKYHLLKNEWIDYSLFLESLAISSMFFDFDRDFTSVDKLLFLVERMNHSLGVKKTMKSSGKT